MSYIGGGIEQRIVSGQSCLHDVAILRDVLRVHTVTAVLVHALPLRGIVSLRPGANVLIRRGQENFP